MRISDWSSDVCSSDLKLSARRLPGRSANQSWSPAICAIAPAGSPLGLRSARPAASIVASAMKRAAAVNAPGVADAAPDGSADQKPERITALAQRSEEHTSELQSLMRTSYADFCLRKKKLKRDQSEL